MKNHIGIWELLAVLGSILTFREEIGGKKLYSFVDNLGDVYVLIRACSKCRVCHAIAKLILRVLNEIHAKAYFIYINTNRNPSDVLSRMDKLLKLISTRSDLIWMQPPAWKLVTKCINELIDCGFDVKCLDAGSSTI